jgi:hypothetical protein
MKLVVTLEDGNFRYPEGDFVQLEGGVLPIDSTNEFRVFREIFENVELPSGAIFVTTAEDDRPER